MTKHTPGPWKIEKRSTHGQFVITTHIVAQDKSHIAEIGPCLIEGNSNLIAAAPEMLKMLEAVISHNNALHDQYKISPALIEHIESIIKKATE